MHETCTATQAGKMAEFKPYNWQIEKQQRQEANRQSMSDADLGLKHHRSAAPL
jgi:hypothetical protein